jgi:uncharacterized protein (TIRG00374 family)
VAAVTDDDAGRPEGERAAATRRQVVAAIVTAVTLVIVFAGVLPQLADYGEAWQAIRRMPAPALVVLAAATIGNIGVYVWPYQAALPGIGYWPAFVVRQTSFAISNGVPGGGAFGLAVQYTMLGQYGFGAADATAAIGATAVWNMFVTLALPVVAVILLILTGAADERTATAAMIGLAVLAGIVGALVVIFRSERAARVIGRFGEGAVGKLASVFRGQTDLGLEAKLLAFRSSTVALVRNRAVVITAANIGQQLMQFIVLFLALRGIQAAAADPVPLVEVFVAFSVGRLGGFIPVTPGGLGTVDAILATLLIASGAGESEAVAAVLVWRVATLFPQIFIGTGTYLYWRRRASA